MEAFVYCRACGQSLHAQAAACPYCGAPQLLAPSLRPPGSPALGIVACVVGVLVLMAMLADGAPPDNDELCGAIGLALVAIVCGVLSIYYRRPGHAAAVVGLATAGVGLLIALSNL
jgi:hypothetical protein